MNHPALPPPATPDLETCCIYIIHNPVPRTLPPTGMRGLCMGLGPALYGLLFWLSDVHLSEEGQGEGLVATATTSEATMATGAHSNFSGGPTLVPSHGDEVSLSLSLSLFSLPPSLIESFRLLLQLSSSSPSSFPPPPSPPLLLPSLSSSFPSEISSFLALPSSLVQSWLP